MLAMHPWNQPAPLVSPCFSLVAFQLTCRLLCLATRTCLMHIGGLDRLQITKCPRKGSIYRRVEGGSVRRQPRGCGDSVRSLCLPRPMGTCSSSATSTPRPWQSPLKTFYCYSVDILTIGDHLLLELAKIILALSWPFSKNGLCSLY